ncbi:TadE/TadG family type IV pilus assembly protein [Rhizobium sp. SSA_523]|uniref:TadE/TadG family type IV pilus assembly protein n=1 Tax=Rhizobium sp. SSA_523 TaxID=2952477 RepID=UPI0020910D92|nr:TadE/TadG family type IV pilus assembly protein [Rhizobium sp. SSA_523]MCO5732787.1 pilus assembly protein [Rhizobium sp. SSA_523]WKC23595.1 pilus assembly protein [Rhizobium sp. SSA_523]
MHLRRLICDRRGIGGVEFAILAPILISLYITCFEITIAFSVSKRVTRAASTIADLVTQQPEVSKTGLGGMIDVAKAIFVPYNSSLAKVSLKITGIRIDQTQTPKVEWSWDQDKARPYAVGTIVTSVPNEMRVASTFLVRTELAVPHELLMFLPGIVSSEARSLTLSRTYFYRQRVGDSVACKDC